MHQAAVGQMIFDTLDLQVVEISSQRLTRAPGYRLSEIDSAVISMGATSSVGEMLTRVAPVFVRSYGQGGLATASLRGASAAHTQVLWNGLLINSPMPGQSDFSMLPVYFVDEISISHGAGSLFQASGGLGGSINLKTGIPRHTTAVELLQEAGSFDTYRSGAKILLGNERLQSSTRLLFSDSKNSYTFLNNALNRENPPEERRRHAAYSQRGLLQELVYNTGNATTLTGRLWMQDNHRRIPANMLVIVPDENEQLAETSIRASLGFDHSTANGNIAFQSGYIFSHSKYQNRLSGIDTDNKVKSLLNSLNYDVDITPSLLIGTSINYNHHHVESDNYPEEKTRTEAALGVTVNYKPGSRAQFHLLLRQEMIDGVPAPFIPSFGISLQPAESLPLLVKANIARNFNKPSLNDLYWMPGGNPGLKNEEGMSYEAGLSLNTSGDRFAVAAEITGFYSDIRNWITWQPDSVFSYWTPSNLRNVVSKGIEADVAITFATGSLRWRQKAGYALTSAKNRKPLTPHDKSVGKQLIYVPKHAFNWAAMVFHQNYQMGYNLNYTGRRFTASDNSRYLPAFALQDVYLMRELRIKRSVYQLKISVNNFTNRQYQVIAWQPMPGRSFTLSVKYRFGKPNDQKQK